MFLHKENFILSLQLLDTIVLHFKHYLLNYWFDIQKTELHLHYYHSACMKINLLNGGNSENQISNPNIYLSFTLTFGQDFYSHSNWVEMGQRSIYLHLLQPEEPAIPVAKGSSCPHLCDNTSNLVIFCVIAYTLQNTPNPKCFECVLVSIVIA